MSRARIAFTGSRGVDCWSRWFEATRRAIAAEPHVQQVHLTPTHITDPLRPARHVQENRRTQQLLHELMGWCLRRRDTATAAGLCAALWLLAVSGAAHAGRQRTGRTEAGAAGQLVMKDGVAG